jgi:drug/metabolite transporter (DMT)-like permease
MITCPGSGVRHALGARDDQSARAHAGDSPLGRRRGLLLVRGTLGFGSITCFFYACQLLPIADATCLTFLGPLIVALLSPCILGERLTAATAVVIPLCCAGVALITRPSFLFGAAHSARLPVLGIAVGLGQPFFSAGAKARARPVTAMYF